MAYHWSELSTGMKNKTPAKERIVLRGTVKSDCSPLSKRVMSLTNFFPMIETYQ